MTVVLVEHRLDLTARFVDHIIIMNEGKVVSDGDPHDILQSEETRLIGVGIPKATRLYLMLRKAGVKLGSTLPLSSEEMATMLQEALKTG
jgi:ABC-type proline/glycine betaine transport system ATPase subunit